MGISSLLACGRVHHHLVRAQLRSRVGLLLESAEAREVRAPVPPAILPVDLGKRQQCCIAGLPGLGLPYLCTGQHPHVLWMDDELCQLSAPALQSQVSPWSTESHCQPLSTCE